MKISVSRDDFVEAVSWVARNANTKGGITAGMLLETHEGGKLLMGATNDATTGKNFLAVRVTDEGKAVLPARLLADFARSLPPGTVELAVEGAGATLTCGEVTFQMATLPTPEYPTLSKMPSGSGTVAGDVFASAVAQVAVAASKDEASLPALTAIRLEMDGNVLRLAATDRYRLAERTVSWSPSETDASGAVLVPRTALSEAAKSFAAAGTPVTVALAAATDDSLVGFANSEAALIARQISGEFPPYKTLFPEEFSANAVVGNDVLTAALKRAALVTTASSAVRVTFSEKGITLEAGETGGPIHKEQVACTFEGEGFTMGFNPTYLAEGVAAAGVENVKISLNGANKPAVITGGENFRYLLMPVRLNG